jgi:23S rRNA pseudouridine955/2504/2580 synthase
MINNNFDKVSFVEINDLQTGQRIDNFLHTYLKNIPRSHVYRILRKGEIRVNKGRIKQTYRLKINDIVRIPPLKNAIKSQGMNISSNSLKFLEQSIIYEDKKLLIINKPAGMAVHGGSGISFGVIEGFRKLYANAPYLELVHRLDRDTSGCLMIAKKPSMLRYLHDLIRNGEISKKYTALVKGVWPSQLKIVQAPLKKGYLSSGERIVRVNDAGKKAITKFKLMEQFASEASFVDIDLLTGRTHQIRVHATHSGHPLAGDRKYGSDNFNKKHKFKRLFLHATEIGFKLDDKMFVIKAPLPKDFTFKL